MMIDPMTTLKVGLLSSEAVTSCMTPMKMASRDGTSQGRPRRKVTVPRKCSALACLEGSGVLVRVVGGGCGAAELPGNARYRVGDAVAGLVVS